MKRSQIAKARKPRKIMIIKPSKYEALELIHSNKKYWNDVFNKLDESKSIKNDSIVTDTLPRDLCDKVSSILNFGHTTKDSIKSEKLTVQNQRRKVKESFISTRKTLKIDREMSSDTDVEIMSGDEETTKGDNIHRDFLRKPIREQITWATRYLQPEKDYEKSLIRRADDLTDRIAKDFCDYMKQLGGDQQSQLFNTKTIKELFQIEFDTHASRGIQVVPKELPSVDDRVAKATESLEHSRTRVLQREISKDIKAEKRPDYLLAFERSVPKREQWRNPKNNTKAMWRSARHVPQDLVTLKTVWEGITHLRSVKDYCRWMIEHPEYKRPPYLRSLGMFDNALLDARLTFELQEEIPRRITLPTDRPTPVDDIRRRLSELVDFA